MSNPVQVTANAIGTARMNRYLNDCGNDGARAHELYSWNISMAGAIYESLHVFEILLRNALDRELKAWNLAQQGTEEWLVDPHSYLKKMLHVPSLTKARSRASEVANNKGRPRTHDDILAQMTLGTWRYLMPSNSNPTKKRMWREATSQAFPLWSGPWPNLVTRIEQVHDIRNRIAHLEPVHHSDLRAVRRSMRDVCCAMGWEQGRIFVEHERMLPLIEAMDAIV